MIKAICVTRFSADCRSSGDSRRRVDAYFVEFRCPADGFNPEGEHAWVCRFEVERGARFELRDFPSKEAAHEAKGFTVPLHTSVTVAHLSI